MFLRSSREVVLRETEILEMCPASNQSLERTPLGWPVCMGVSSMVSLSSRR